ncbi:MAG: hypothetical protein HP491_18680, partial [Nitrospira sp.]|nr:hypothetical protein [Nitrospira sp.]
LGADISFDAYGDISGYHTYVGEVKGSQFQFTDPITNEAVVAKPTAPVESTEARINLTSISTRTISPGEKVSWNFEVTVQPGYIKGIYVTLIDSQGQARRLFIDGSTQFKGYVVDKAKTYNTDLTLYTHSSLAPGSYSIASFCLEASKRDCVTDPKYAKSYNPSKENRSVDLEKFSFQVKDIGSNFQEKPLQINKITGKKSAYSPGEVMSYEVEATGKMAFDQANMSLNFGNNSVNASCQKNYYSNCSFVQDKDKGITKITFTFPIPEDLPPGKFEISSIYLSSSNASISTGDTSINTTAAWTSSFSYQNNVRDNILFGKEYDEEKYKLNYAIGVWGGVGANLTREGTAVSQNVLPPTGGGGPNAGTTRTYNYDTRFLTGEMMYTARVLYKIAGNPGYGQGDILNSRTPQAAIAFGYAYDPAQNYLSSIRSDIVERAFRQRVAAAYNGRLLGGGIYDFHTYELDFIAKYQGWSIQAEGFYRDQNVRNANGGTKPFDLGTIPTSPLAVGPPVALGDAWGWYVQVGKYVIPRKLEVAVRYGVHDPSIRQKKDLTKELGIAISYSFDGTYNNRLILDYSNITMGSGGRAPDRFPFENLPGFGLDLVENRFNVQYQFFF